MNIDFDSFFRNRIEALLIQASWVGAIQSLLGLRATSQVWNGRAEWYLWLNRAPGVYALSFVDGESTRINGRPAYEGLFTVKCFPYRDHPGFADYSPNERRLVQSDRFDITNTPRFEALAKIPDSLFGIGSLSLVLDACGHLALLSYESLDALKIFQAREPSVDGRQDVPLTVIRNVPGWASGWPLFDCMVGLYANVCKRPPVFVGVTRSPGFEYLMPPDREPTCCPSEATCHMAVSIGFDPGDGVTAALEDCWHQRLEPEEQILAAAALPSRLDGLPKMQLPESCALNPLWWTIANSNFKSELNTACGCSDGHCHHG
jgi:hypothetical protein